MPSYKLQYFDGQGRAEVARLLFSAAGVAFEDERLAGEAWQTAKPSKSGVRIWNYQHLLKIKDAYTESQQPLCCFYFKNLLIAIKRKEKKDAHTESQSTFIMLLLQSINC